MALLVQFVLLFFAFIGAILEPDEEFAVLFRERVVGEDEAAFLPLCGLVVVLLGGGGDEMYSNSLARQP